MLNSDCSRSVRHSAEADEDHGHHEHEHRENSDCPFQCQQLEFRVKQNSLRKIGYHKGFSRHLSGGSLSGFGGQTVADGLVVCVIDGLHGLNHLV